MSFVIPTAKAKSKAPDAPGPGEYLPLTSNIPKPSCAPFNSSGIRSETEGKKQTITPGPGQYKPVDFKDVYNCQPQGTTIFKSKVPRFKQPVRSVSQARQDRKKASGDRLNVVSTSPKKRNNDMMEVIRSSNNKRKIPSIKNPKQYVRVVYTDPHNTQNVISKYVNVDYINKNVGPGDYDVESSMADGKGAGWSHCKEKRFHTVGNANPLGPGYYDVNTNHDAKNATSSFASQSIRSHFDNIIYKTNIKDLAHLREYIHYKDAAPGPGHYQNSLIQPASNNTFQFFGSTSERFVEKISQSSNDLGPGFYNVDIDRKPQNQRQRNRLHTKSVLEKRNQISIPPKRKETPGPGQYSSAANTLKQQLFDKFRRGYHGDFGTRETRFKTQSLRSKPLPGPGEYSVDKAQSSNPPPNVTYITESKRANPFPKKQATPFGEYNVGVYDLARVLNKKKQFLDNLKKIEVYKPPFESGVQRFNTQVQEPQKNQEQIRVEQIGLMSQAYNQKRRLLKPYKGSEQTGNFKSRSKRFLTSVPNIPPPGYYSTPGQIEKSSYNVKYGYKKIP